MIKTFGLSLIFSLVFVALGCERAPETKTENTNVPAGSAPPSKTPDVPLKSEQTIPIDVARLAGKSVAELDNFFGAPPEKSSGNGAYRLYKIAGQSKGLAVRFYGGRAKNFNLILDQPFRTSKEALKQIFNIDVGNSAPLKDATEPLSEKYQGTFGGVKFKKVSARKQADGDGFIFVLAEVSE
jgi:hypothetical protein